MTHPTTHEALSSGEFVVQQTENQPFSQTAMDQTLEQTLNKMSKTRGGMVGFTMNPGAVHRWISTFADRAEIQACCEAMAGRKDHE